MILAEIIKAKIEIAEKDKYITFNKLMETKESNPDFKKLKKKYWELQGEIEAYTDILVLVESGKYE